MNRFYRDYQNRGFEFITVYVREPHPGENYSSHASWEQKVQYARDCREQDGIETKLLVDSLDGKVHLSYGSMPNMIYIVDRHGKIAYKSMWTDHGEISAVLENLVLADRLQAEGIRVKPSYTEKINYVPAQYGEGIRQKVFDRAGPQAWSDYEKVFTSKVQ